MQNMNETCLNIMIILQIHKKGSQIDVTGRGLEIHAHMAHILSLTLATIICSTIFLIEFSLC